MPTGPAVPADICARLGTPAPWSRSDPDTPGGQADRRLTDIRHGVRRIVPGPRRPPCACPGRSRSSRVPPGNRLAIARRRSPRAPAWSWPTGSATRSGPRRPPWARPPSRPLRRRRCRQVRALVAATIERFGGLDLMVANAAVQAESSSSTSPRWSSTASSGHLEGAFLCGQTAARHMVETGRRGASSSSRRSTRRWPTPCSCTTRRPRAASRCSRRGWPSASRRTVPRPRHRARDGGRPSTSTSPTRMKDGLLMRTPLGSIAAAEETARLAVFLASDDAS